MLSTEQRIAIRAIADRKPVDEAVLDSLVTAKLATYDGGFGPKAALPALTRKGKTAHTQIMSSGDGPEDLKAMFRF